MRVTLEQYIAMSKADRRLVTMIIIDGEKEWPAARNVGEFEEYAGEGHDRGTDQRGFNK